ncbi:MAG TPA: major capsid protein P2 [Verrucomicrobiae bacterium]|nr:major capsid protein P2 [Verrucomicrobiae bacterium]
MVKYRVQLRNVQNVAASTTALIDVPCGQRYHYIVLTHGYASGTNTIAGAEANITEIRVKSNSRIQRRISGTQLRDMNLLNGTQYDCTGVPNTSPGVTFPIYFNEPWRETPADQDALAWSTAGWLSFQVEVDLGAASTPTLQAWAVIDDFVPAPNGPVPGIVKWLKVAAVPGGTIYDYNQLDRRDYLQQISIYPDSGGSQSPTQVTFKKNSVILHELTSAANTALLNNYHMYPGASGRTAGIYDLVFDHDGLLSSSVPMDGARDSLLEVSAGSAMSGTQTYIVQRLGPPE